MTLTGAGDRRRAIGRMTPAASSGADVATLSFLTRTHDASPKSAAGRCHRRGCGSLHSGPVFSPIHVTGSWPRTSGRFSSLRGRCYQGGIPTTWSARAGLLTGRSRFSIP